MGKEELLINGWNDLFGDCVKIDDQTILHKAELGNEIDRLYINNKRLADGFIKGKIIIENEAEGERQGQFVFRYINSEKYYFAGIGGYHKKFSIGKRIPESWVGFKYLGDEKEVEFGREYEIKVIFMGTKIELFLGEVKIAEFYDNDFPYLSGNVGLRTRNKNKVSFKNVTACGERAKSFVVMPFKPEYGNLYDNFIKEIVENSGLEVKRADEIFGTRPIIRDIFENIQKCRIIIAFLTESNPNVLYEIGVAHTLKKEVIIITPDVNKLPFDIKHLRCIQYSDSLLGGEKLKRELKETINSILSQESSEFHILGI